MSVLKRDKSKTKKFDRSLFDTYDSPARLVVLDYIHKQGVHAIDNDDKYGPDLVMFRGYKPFCYIEVEVKKVWRGSIFPWSTIQLPGRKAKFTKLGLPMEFWILNEGLTHAIVIPDTALEDSLLQEVPNKYISEGEMFYQVPITACNLVTLTTEESDGEQ